MAFVNSPKFLRLAAEARLLRSIAPATLTLSFFATNREFMSRSTARLAHEFSLLGLAPATVCLERRREE
jgi:hypothetical protein